MTKHRLQKFRTSSSISYTDFFTNNICATKDFTCHIYIYIETTGNILKEILQFQDFLYKNVIIEKAIEMKSVAINQHVFMEQPKPTFDYFLTETKSNYSLFGNAIRKTFYRVETTQFIWFENQYHGFYMIRVLSGRHFLTDYINPSILALYLIYNLRKQPLTNVSTK